MAKNKGLTPKRKKIDRNPRVKNREKFRRAKIRRKGQVCVMRSLCFFLSDCSFPYCHQSSILQMPFNIETSVCIWQVRDVRREDKKYSGELSGIRAGVKKSTKLK